MDDLPRERETWYTRYSHPLIDQNEGVLQGLGV